MSKKPVRLEFSTELISTAPSDSIRVEMKGEKKAVEQKKSTDNAPITGQVKIRKEVKQRAGHPVHVLFDFTDPRANGNALLTLCKTLKDKLGCGGSVEDKRVILQCTDPERIAKLLVQNGMQPKIC